MIEEVPQFSEIFPADWDMPTFDVQEDIEVENNGYLQDENSVTPLINSDDVMVTVFSDTLKLRVPSNSDTPAFDTFDTTYWYNYYHYNMTYVYTRGYDRDSSSWYKNYYNVGYSNAKTGASLGWKTNIESWDTFGITLQRILRLQFVQACIAIILRWNPVIGISMCLHFVRF